MDPINNVDRLVLLLQERLAERSKTSRGGAVRSGAPQRKTPVETVRALAGIEGVDDRHLRRALVQNLLVESFGEKVVSDARFQQVVERVTQTIQADPRGADLLQRLVGELKAEAAR